MHFHSGGGGALGGVPGRQGSTVASGPHGAGAMDTGRLQKQRFFQNAFSPPIGMKMHGGLLFAVFFIYIKKREYRGVPGSAGEYRGVPRQVPGTPGDFVLGFPVSSGDPGSRRQEGA